MKPKHYAVHIHVNSRIHPSFTIKIIININTNITITITVDIATNIKSQKYRNPKTIGPFSL